MVNFNPLGANTPPPQKQQDPPKLTKVAEGVWRIGDCEPYPCPANSNLPVFFCQDESPNFGKSLYKELAKFANAETQQSRAKTTVVNENDFLQKLNTFILKNGMSGKNFRGLFSKVPYYSATQNIFATENNVGTIIQHAPHGGETFYEIRRWGALQPIDVPIITNDEPLKNIEKNKPGFYIGNDGEMALYKDEVYNNIFGLTQLVKKQLPSLMDYGVDISTGIDEKADNTDGYVFARNSEGCAYMIDITKASAQDTANIIYPQA